MRKPVLWRLWRKDYRAAWQIRIWSRRIRHLDDRMLGYVAAFARLQEERRSVDT